MRAFKQSGILRVNSIDEFLRRREKSLLALFPISKIPGVAIITNAGGAGRSCERRKHRVRRALANFTTETIKPLRNALPQGATSTTPIDILGDASRADM